MNKKLLFTFLIVLFFFNLILSFVFSQDSMQGFEEGMEKIEDTKEKIDTYSDKDKWREKWDYLGERWKEIFLNNPVLKSIDYIFTKISFIFFIILSQHYSFSLIFFGVFILWIFIVLDVGDIINSWGIAGQGILPYLASFSLSTAFAWTGALNSIVVLLGRLIFSPEHWWTRFLVFLIVVSGFIFLRYLSVMLSRFFKLRRESLEKSATNLAQKQIQKFAEKMSDASKTQV